MSLFVVNRGGITISETKHHSTYVVRSVSFEQDVGHGFASQGHPKSTVVRNQSLSLKYVSAF